MKKQRILILAASLLAPQATLHAAAKPPNLVVFVVDDMDYASINANGCPVPGLTPNMDRLASEGVIFEFTYIFNAWSDGR